MKLDADASPAAVARYGVRAIPNLVLLRAGQVGEQIIGAVPRARLVQAIERVLGA